MSDNWIEKTMLDHIAKIREESAEAAMSKQPIDFVNAIDRVFTNTPPNTLYPFTPGAEDSVESMAGPLYARLSRLAYCRPIDSRRIDNLQILLEERRQLAVTALSQTQEQRAYTLMMINHADDMIKQMLNL